MGTIHDYYLLENIMQNIDFTYFAYYQFRAFDQIKYLCHTGKYGFKFSMHSNSSPKKKKSSPNSPVWYTTKICLDGALTASRPHLADALHFFSRRAQAG
jgi:hypothetical protein